MRWNHLNSVVGGEEEFGSRFDAGVSVVVWKTTQRKKIKWSRRLHTVPKANNKNGNIFTGSLWWVSANRRKWNYSEGTPMRSKVQLYKFSQTTNNSGVTTTMSIHQRCWRIKWNQIYLKKLLKTARTRHHFTLAPEHTETSASTLSTQRSRSRIARNLLRVDEYELRAKKKNLWNSFLTLILTAILDEIAQIVKIDDSFQPAFWFFFVFFCPLCVCVLFSFEKVIKWKFPWMCEPFWWVLEDKFVLWREHEKARGIPIDISHFEINRWECEKCSSFAKPRGVSMIIIGWANAQFQFNRNRCQKFWLMALESIPDN